jgi:hypothetical protein
MAVARTSPTHYIVQTASAKMPGNCWGQYRHVAVLSVDAHLDRVKMLSERSIGCHGVVWHSGPQNVGKTARCAYRKSLMYARKLANRLNAERGTQHA